MSSWPPRLLLQLWNWGREKSHSTRSSQQHPEILLRVLTSKNFLALGLPASICGVWAHVLENMKPMDFLFMTYFPFLREHMISQGVLRAETSQKWMTEFFTVAGLRSPTISLYPHLRFQTFQSPSLGPPFPLKWSFPSIPQRNPQSATLLMMFSPVNFPDSLPFPAVYIILGYFRQVRKWSSNNLRNVKGRA